MIILLCYNITVMFKKSRVTICISIIVFESDYFISEPILTPYDSKSLRSDLGVLSSAATIPINLAFLRAPPEVVVGRAVAAQMVTRR